MQKYLQFCTNTPACSKLMHRLCTSHKILCTEIMHGRALDYAWVLKDYAEVCAILDGLHTRARRLCTDYAHATKYYARRLCTDYARARHRLCTGTEKIRRRICNSGRIPHACYTMMQGLYTRHRLCTGTKQLYRSICNSVQITPARYKTMHRLCTRHNISCTEIMQRLCTGAP